MVKITPIAVLTLLLLPLATNAFISNSIGSTNAFGIGSTSLLRMSHEEEGRWQQKAMSAVLTSCVLWNGIFAFDVDNVVDHQSINMNHPRNVHVHMANIAQAKEMASGSGARVNKDADSLLRYGLPINCKQVRNLQVTIENIKQDVASKRKSAALDGVKKSKSILKKDAGKISGACRTPSECTTIMSQMEVNLEPLEASLKAAQDALQGSDQERTALDQAYQTQDKLSKQLTALEESMVPEDYAIPVPEEYLDLPRLKGRATVEMVFKKGDVAPSSEDDAGDQFNIEGKLFKEAKMTMIIDGYAAPITGGNFVELVDNGFYTNMKIQRSDGFVVQTGKPDGKAEGYTGGKPSKAIGAGKFGERLIPTEILLVGDKQPIYESTVEDEGRGGEASVLPFSSYGAMGWAREEYDVNSGSSQFFWLLFDSDLTPAGKNVLDGRYPCFGYVVDGADFLRDIKEGDIITSAKVTSGLDTLVLPKAD